MTAYLASCEGVLTFVGDTPTCAGTWVAVQDSGAEVAAAMTNMVTALDGFFGFNLELFSMVTSACLVSWAIGHGVGRMMQAWRKST